MALQAMPPGLKMQENKKLYALRTQVPGPVFGVRGEQARRQRIGAARIVPDTMLLLQKSAASNWNDEERHGRAVAAGADRYVPEAAWQKGRVGGGSAANGRGSVTVAPAVRRLLRGDGRRPGERGRGSAYRGRDGHSAGANARARPRVRHDDTSRTSCSI